MRSTAGLSALPSTSTQLAAPLIMKRYSPAGISHAFHLEEPIPSVHLLMDGRLAAARIDHQGEERTHRASIARVSVAGLFPMEQRACSRDDGERTRTSP